MNNSSESIKNIQHYYFWLRFAQDVNYKLTNYKLPEIKIHHSTYSSNITNINYKNDYSKYSLILSNVKLFKNRNIVNQMNKSQHKPLKQVLTTETMQDGLYIYTWDALRDAWMIGKNNTETANAVIGGLSECPKDIIIPGRLPRGDKQYPVEVIGQYSFYDCGRIEKTRSIYIPKEIKYIKTYAFQLHDKVTNFTLEAGSKLETLEYLGFGGIGYNNSNRSFQSQIDPSKTLILPSSLSFVEKGGINLCNLFNRIIYCGSHYLPNSCDLSNKEPQSRVYVTTKYKYFYVMGHSPSNDIPINVITEICNNFEGSAGKDCIQHNYLRPVSLILILSLQLLTAPRTPHTDPAGSRPSL